MDAHFGSGAHLDGGSYLLDFPSRLCAHTSTKMVDAVSQFSLDMHDGLAEDQPDSILLFEEDDQEVSNATYYLYNLLRAKTSASLCEILGMVLSWILYLLCRSHSSDISRHKPFARELTPNTAR